MRRALGLVEPRLCVRWALIAALTAFPLRLTWLGVYGGDLVGCLIVWAVLVAIVWGITE